MSLGIDLGTSELKTVLMDSTGSVRGQACVRLDVHRPQAGWSEQAPQDWWAACIIALGQLRASWPQDYARIACIGLSGQMHGAVLLDAHDAVIRPAILWNDARAEAEAASLARDYPAYADITGSLPMAGLTAPKLLWLQKHEPAAFAAIACVLSPKDYLRLRLTGIKLTDMSDAAGTLWLDEAKRAWFAPMLSACALTLAQMPALAEGDAATGKVLASIAEQLGLPLDVVVAGGGGDNPVSAVGIGAVNGGDSFISLGTSAAIVSVTEEPLGKPDSGVHSFCHALPGRWYAMGAILSGASCLRWATSVLGQPDEAALLALVEAHLPLDAPSAPSAPLFLPYLSGERTPHNDPQVRGAFLQLGHDSTPAQLGYAVLEGVAFALRDAMAAVTSTGAVVPHCMLVGGGARSQYWAQLLANVLGREMRTLHNSELSASLGAAKLGFAAIGDTSLLAQGLPVKNTFLPDAAHSAALSLRYARYRSLFPAVQALHQLSKG
ncbi:MULTISPECIES: xylulokinase [unclassified Janthinobacterium]|uniref:xylulokinase n=1 Tax=unclassified Janthinobacterium TaxID=2610881 RepID=UPI0018CB95EF